MERNEPPKIDRWEEEEKPALSYPIVLKGHTTIPRVQYIAGMFQQPIK